MVGRLESKKVPGLYTKAVARRVAGELCARFSSQHSNSNRNEARAAAETDIEEESSVKRRKLLHTLIANSNVIHENKSHPVISLLISPYRTSPRFGGRFPDSRKPSGNAWHSRKV